MFWDIARRTCQTVEGEFVGRPDRADGRVGCRQSGPALVIVRWAYDDRVRPSEDAHALDLDVWRPDSLGVVFGLQLLRDWTDSFSGSMCLYRSLTTRHQDALAETAPQAIGFEEAYARVPGGFPTDPRSDPGRFATVRAGTNGVGLLLQPFGEDTRVARITTNLPEPVVTPVPADRRPPSVTRSPPDDDNDLMWLTALHLAASLGYGAIAATLGAHQHYVARDLLDRAGFRPMLDVARVHGLSPVDGQRVLAQWCATVVGDQVEFTYELCRGTSDPAIAPEQLLRHIAELGPQSDNGELQLNTGGPATDAASLVGGSMRGRLLVSGFDGPVYNFPSLSDSAGSNETGRPPHGRQRAFELNTVVTSAALRQLRSPP